MSKNDRKFAVPATYLKMVLQEAAVANVAPKKLLASTALTVEQVMRSDDPLPLETTLIVLGNAQRLLGEGWHLGLAERFSVAAHGPIGFAVATAPDVGKALQVMLRFMAMRAPFLWAAGNLEGDRFVLRLYETVDLGLQRGTLVEMAVLSLSQLLEGSMGRPVHGATIAFALPEPCYLRPLEQAFHADVTFSAEQHMIGIPASWVDLRCAQSDAAMHQFLVHHCEQQQAQSADLLPTGISVRQALLAQPGKARTLTLVAESLHVSPRTLIRRLKQEHTSFQDIVDDVRQTLARDLLLHSELGIGQIAWQLGFQDPSNFGRAFRGWFGMSPSAFRRHR